MSSCSCANSLRRFGFSVTSWNESSATLAVKSDIKSLQTAVYPSSISFSHRARSQLLDLRPPDLMPYARFAWLTCSTVGVRSTTVSFLLRCHASGAGWNRYFSFETTYRRWTPMINTAGFWSGSRLYPMVFLALMRLSAWGFSNLGFFA